MVPRAVYGVIGIIILAIVGGLPAYVAVGQGGSNEAHVTITATPAFSVGGGGGGGGGGAPECPEGEVATSGRATSGGLVFQPFILRSPDKRFTIYLNEGIVVLTPDGICPQCIGIHDIPQQPPQPQGAQFASLVYDAVPDLTAFTPPATIVYNYDPADIPAEFTAAELLIATSDPATGEWIGLACVVDTEAHTITSQIGRFNDLAVICYEPIIPAPASFQPSSLIISPTEIEAGEAVNISVMVANTGGSTGSYAVMFRIDGVVEEIQKITLDAGISQTVSFTTSKQLSGTHSVEVNGLTGTFEVRQPEIPVTPVLPEPFNWWLIVIIAAAVAAGVAIYLYRKKLSPVVAPVVAPVAKRVSPVYRKSAGKSAKWWWRTVYESRRLWWQTVNRTRNRWQQVRKPKNPQPPQKPEPPQNPETPQKPQPPQNPEPPQSSQDPKPEP